MSAGGFTGSKIPHVLGEEPHLISMTGHNLTALKLGVEVQRADRASDLPGLSIPKMEAKRYEGKIKAGAEHLHHG
jgi:hypothetical protein